MNPGKLNRRIVLQARTGGRDAAGGVTEQWNDSANLWAEQVRQTGTEGQQADADRNQDTRQFRVRWREDLAHPDATSKFRILYQLRFFDIRAITEEGVKTTLLIDAVATQKIS